MKDRYILSIDGGGVRGIIAAKAFSMTRIKPELFDIITGSSIGGIIGTAYSFYTPFQVNELLNIYAKDIFKKGLYKKIKSLGGFTESEYNIKNLKKVMQEIFQELTLNRCRNETLITSVDIQNRKPKIFKSKQDEYKIYDVLCSTAAAQTFFSPYVFSNGTFVDGGSFLNNPVLCGIAEAKNNFPNDRINVLSIGCGTNKKPIDVGDGGLFQWLKKGRIVEVFMDCNTDGMDFFVKTFFPNINYLRLQINLEEDIKLDDVSNINKLNDLGHNMYYQNVKKVIQWKNAGGII
jgi:uncharacterized protein